MLKYIEKYTKKNKNTDCGVVSIELEVINYSLLLLFIIFFIYQRFEVPLKGGVSFDRVHTNHHTI